MPAKSYRRCSRHRMLSSAGRLRQLQVAASLAVRSGSRTIPRKLRSNFRTTQEPRQKDSSNRYRVACSSAEPILCTIAERRRSGKGHLTGAAAGICGVGRGISRAVAETQPKGKVV